MIKFNVGGQYLELPADFDLQFQKKNILFAFDDIECERSTSFDIHLTTTNARILKLDYDPHLYGMNMRKGIDAQMQAGQVVKDGKIFFTAYNPKDKTISCLFVFGEAIVIKAISDEGKISEYYHPNTGCNWNGQYISQQSNLFKTWIYAQGSDVALDASHSKPSINLFTMAANIAAQFGLQLTSTNNMAKNLQYMPEKLYKSDGTEAEFGNTVYMRYSLPDVTFGELLKIIAYLSGCVISISGNTIAIERGNMSGWSRQDITNKVISVNQYTRTFGDFARWNKIIGIWTSRFASDIKSRTLTGYLVDNENIGDESDLYELTIPTPSETVRVGSDYMAWLGGEPTTNWIALRPYDTTHQMIVLQDEGAYQAGVPANEIITNLCTVSTTCEVVIRCTLLEYELMKDKTIIWYDGAEWVWTEAQYENGQATLKLAKLQ